MPRGKAASNGEDGMELIGTVQIGGFAGIDEGSAVVRPLEVAVNKDLAGLATRFSERIHGEKISVYKEQLPASRNGQMSAVEKKWKEVQKPLNAGSSSLPSGEREYDSPHNSGNSGEPSNIAILKNAYDELKKDVRNMGNWVKVGLILGTLGVVGFIVSLALALK